jgi:predicted AAA+ superfamily ATPase
MQDSLLKRNIEEALLEALSDTPVVIIQGARQTGKSTLLSMTADKINSKQLTLDDPQMLLAAESDPLSFVEQYAEGTLVIDEAQLCPDLLRIIKMSVDRARRPGRFLLTGSADLLHVSGANESLAGRSETIRLHPFSLGEINGVKEDFVTTVNRGDILGVLRGCDPLDRAEYVDLVARGGYPTAVLRSERRRSAYLRSYVSGIFDHDAAVISSLAHLDKLSKLYAILSATTSGIYVQASISRLSGIPETSMNGYIRLLKDLWLLNEFPAWGRSILRRASSKPKYAIADTGVACQVNGVQSSFLADITGGEALGPLLESFVANELLKQQSWSMTEYRVFHFHDHESREVDIVVELPNGKVMAIEVKASRTISRKDFRGMSYLRDMLNDRFHCGLVLYTGAEVQSYGDRIYSAPISALWTAL